MSRELTRQLKELKAQDGADFQPSKKWVQKNKEQLFAQIQHTTQQERQTVQPQAKIAQWIQIFVPPQQVLALRGAFVVLLVFGVATTGLFASASPLPRDIVFNVKVAVATATRNTEAKGKLHLGEASYQTKQLQQKVAETDGDKEKKKKETGKQIEKIQKQLTAAQKNLEKTQEKSPKKATQLAKDLSVETSAIAGDLKLVSQQTKETGEDPELSKELVGVRKQVFEAGIDALEVLSGAIGEQEPEKKLDETQVKEIELVLGDKVEEILEEAESLAKEVEEKKLVLEETLNTTSSSTSSTPELNLVTSSIEVTSTSSSSSAIGQSVDVKQEVQKELEVLEEEANKTEEFAAHIKTLLEGDQVEKAVEVLKEVTDIKAQSEEKLIDVDTMLKEVVIEEPSIEQNVKVKTP